MVAIPRYRWIQLTILAVLIAAFVTSFQSGAEGAHQSGYRAEFSASFPLICDVVAMLATVVHGWARHDVTMRRWCAGFVLVPLMLSWAANAVNHLANAGIILSRIETPDGWIWAVWVVLAAGVCPVAVAALLLFATKFTEFERRDAMRSTEEQAPEPVVATAEIDPEFVEPEPVVTARRPEIAPAVQALHAVPDAVPDDGADFEAQVEAMYLRHRKPGMHISREVAAAMVRNGIPNRSKWTRLPKEERDALLA